MSKSRNSVITQLGGTFLFLEDCPTHHQNKHFPDFIEQHVQEWQEHNTGGINDDNRKPMKEFSKPEVVKIRENYYFVSGMKQIFQLNHEHKFDGENDFLAKKLSQEEIKDLEVEIIWTGNQEFNFEVDEKEAMRLLASIIHNMNLMQEDKFYSYPLGMEVFPN